MSLPEPRLPDPVAGQQCVPAHHRPPRVDYIDGVPYHYTVGQPPAPAQIVVQMPEQRGMDPALQRLIVVTFLILAVVVVCTSAVIAVVVMVGGTLMGIIGTVSQNLPFIGVTLVGVIVAAGWAANKIRPRKKD